VGPAEAAISTTKGKPTKAAAAATAEGRGLVWRLLIALAAATVAAAAAGTFCRTAAVVTAVTAAAVASKLCKERRAKLIGKQPLLHMCCWDVLLCLA
jgi:hypothetical protein